MAKCRHCLRKVEIWNNWWVHSGNDDRGCAGANPLPDGVLFTGELFDLTLWIENHGYENVRDSLWND